MAENKYRAGVVILLENPHGELAMQLRDDSRWYGYWGLFGGWLEEGESVWNGVQREISEELCITLQPEKLTCKGIHDLVEIQAKCWVFHYSVENELDRASLQEGLEWRFMSLNEIFHAPIVTHQLAMIRQYYAY